MKNYISSLSPIDQVTFLNTILESSTEYSIIALDFNKNILAWNEGARRIYGYDLFDVLGKDVSMLYDPAEVESGKSQLGYDETLRSGKWSGEVERIRKNGTRFTAHVIITLRRDSQDVPIGYTVMSSDLTETQLSLHEFKESQAYTRGLIEASINVFIVTDLLGIIRDVNQHVCEVIGCPRDQIIGVSLKKYFTEPKRVENVLRLVLAEDKISNNELIIYSKSGNEIPLSCNLSIFQSSEGKLKGIVLIGHDVTEWNRLERDLRQAQNYTRGLIEASADALLTVNPDYEVMDVNEQIVKRTGCSREELTGSLFTDYFADPILACEAVKQTLTAGVVVDYPLVLLSKDNKETPVAFNGSVFKDMQGNVQGVFASIHDVTAQKRLEDDLRQAQNYTRGLIEASVDPMIVVSPDLTIMDVNKQMVALTETPKDRLVGSRFDSYFRDQKRAAVGVSKTLSEGYVTNYELTLQASSGKETVVSFNASIFRDLEGSLKGIFAVARDVTEERQLELKFQEQQNYSRSLIEASVDALITVDPNGLVTDVNEQMIKLIGESRKRLIGSAFANYFTDPRRARAGIKKTLKDGVVKNYELTARSKSGRETPTAFNASIYKDMTGKVLGVFGAARDIRDQKFLETELRNQQAYTRGLIESNIDALMTTDTLGIITDVNEQMLKITGRTRKELIGNPFKKYFTNPQRAEEGIQRVLVENWLTNYELTFRAKDGKETDVSYNATTFRTQDGKLEGVFAAARDITEQKKLQAQIYKQNQELIETTNFLNNILDSSTEYSIVVCDLEGNILAWNAGAYKIYGYTADEMINKHNIDYLHTSEDIESGRIKALFRTALKTGKAEGIFERIRKNKEKLIASLGVTLRKDANGNPIGYLAISKDITAQRQLEEQSHLVQEGSRLKSEFLANMSHELRTPLNGIIGFAELMYNEKVGPISSEHKDFLNDILLSARHLQQLINDILDLSKVESGKMEFHSEPIDLGRTLNEVRDILRTLIAHNQIDFETQIDPTLTDIVLDQSKFKQILYNYISNAVKFTPGGGKVTVRILKEDNLSFRVEVEDTGIGIRKKDIGKLFAEFVQLDSSISKQYQGTGLGLALTRRIVNAQGGRVGVKSTFGKGSLFFAILPRKFPQLSSEEVVKIPLEKNVSKIQSNAPRILVVEDDPQDQLIISEILKKAGFDVEIASNGKEALTNGQREHFDAITLDILLPDMSGLEVLHALRTQSPNEETPIVVVTIVEQKALSFGDKIQDCLSKPVKPEVLLKVLDAAGVKPHEKKTILIIDDDAPTLKYAQSILKDTGHCIVSCLDGKSGLLAVNNEKPDVIILDLLMPNMDGFQFLQHLRKTKLGKEIPVIVWTAKDLTRDDQKILKKLAQSVVLKGEGSIYSVASELQSYLPVPVKIDKIK